MSIERMSAIAEAGAPRLETPRPAAQRPAPPEPAAAAAPSRAELRATVDNLNRYLKSVDQGVQFEIDEGTGRTVVRVVDRTTAEVIRQMPSDEMLAIARSLARAKGFLFDDQA
jgi:flagellar protein FlaG